MARPGRPARNTTARSFRQLRRFHHVINSDKVFGTHTRSRAHRLADEFAAFAATADQSHWCVWTVHRPPRKTASADLVADLQQFNRHLNSVFGQLRKHCGFELLIIGIHIDFDLSTGLFDIHSHFACKIAPEFREEARRRLMTAFSSAHTPDDKLRSPYGFAKYASRTFKLARVVRWPSDALLAARNLINHRFQYVRTAGAFAKWREQRRA